MNSTFIKTVPSLKTWQQNRHQCFFSQINCIASFLNNFQLAFGWLLFVDLSLLLFFWLSHWYMAFVSIKVSALAVAGPILVIIAETWRVIGISTACENITQRSMDVAMKVTEVKIGLTDEKDIKVGNQTKPWPRSVSSLWGSWMRGRSSLQAASLWWTDP